MTCILDSQRVIQIAGAYPDFLNLFHYFSSLEVLHLHFLFSPRQPPNSELFHFLCAPGRKLLSYLNLWNSVQVFLMGIYIPQIFASLYWLSLKMKVDY